VSISGARASFLPVKSAIESVKLETNPAFVPAASSVPASTMA